MRDRPRAQPMGGTGRHADDPDLAADGARRRWQSLVILGLLMALATTTVLAAIAGSRRGDTAMGRLLDKTRPATLTVLPNQPGFNWAPIRALPEVETLTTFAVVGFDIKGNPAASQNVSFPFTDGTSCGPSNGPSSCRAASSTRTGWTRSTSAASSLRPTARSSATASP